MELLIITGPPYSGKGTQCEVLKANSGFSHISTGERIRKEKDEKTPFGLLMIDYETNGSLVPDVLMQELLGNILNEHAGAKGIILDGYPRTKAQVDTLLSFLSERNISVKLVINIDVPHEELLARAKKTGRNFRQGR